VERIEFNEGEDFGKFLKKAEELGASYVEGKQAIFVSPGKWHKNVSTNEYVKAGISWKMDKGVDIGQIIKSCNNFEEKSCNWYDKSDIKWFIETLSKISFYLK